MKIYNGSLEVEAIFNQWYNEEKESNYGANVSFVGVVRAEDEIEALSFDIYEPILFEWFNQWQEKAKQLGAKIKMAHSLGDVKVHTSSFMCAIFSPKRRVALELIDVFVEDFKANAPIWKYDIIGGKRVYAQERSTPMSGAGILKGLL
ncbi:MAG: molybdenum cofactor biosynthesis protein MoaE [Sulfurovum sp.]|jgi:molybdopterin synthase catalytic subunit|nr:MAG: molybdenum cofactor biosynthesis protein MoaE [Sulfurovum sp.]